MNDEQRMTKSIASRVSDRKPALTIHFFIHFAFVILFHSMSHEGATLAPIKSIPVNYRFDYQRAETHDAQRESRL
jgi:hypothetical protein